MCMLKSMILTQDKVFCPDYDSHSNMLVEMGIKDNSLVPSFVKIEITPPNGDMRCPPEKWQYSVDQDELPPWYVQEIDEPRCRKSLVDWYGAHVFTEGHHEVRSGKVWLFGTATADLYNNSSATLRENSSARLYNNATAELCDRSVSIYRANYWARPVVRIAGDAND